MVNDEKRYHYIYCITNIITQKYYVERSKWWQDQLVKDAVAKSKSLSEVIRHLGFSVTGTAYSAAKRHIKRLSLSTEHFTPQNVRLREYRKSGGAYTRKSNDEIFVEHSTCDRSIIKKRIQEENLIPYVCAKCNNNGHWMDEPLTLQLEHKNGTNDDNRLENLEFLCPNCHSQTKTWSGRNTKRS